MGDDAAEVFSPEGISTARRIDGRVKWFNQAKGFGFVVTGDGSPDAFLPIAILRRSGHEDVSPGASVTCEIVVGAKGPLVATILNIDESTADAGSSRQADGRFRQPMKPAGTIEGVVKWFAVEKGYGFLLPDAGGKDIFLHVTALRRSGLETVEAGQRLRVDTVEGPKGLEAARLVPI